MHYYANPENSRFHNLDNLSHTAYRVHNSPPGKKYLGIENSDICLIIVYIKTIKGCMIILQKNNMNNIIKNLTYFQFQIKNVVTGFIQI